MISAACTSSLFINLIILTHYTLQVFDVQFYIFKSKEKKAMSVCLCMLTTPQIMKSRDNGTETKNDSLSEGQVTASVNVICIKFMFCIRMFFYQVV